MIVTLKEVLSDAKKKHYGIGAFNAVNMEMVRGVIAAAEELNSPVIIGTAEVLTKYTPLDTLTYLLRPLAEKSKIPVVLHFDHGLSEQKIVEAMRLGFSSVMYDCSLLPYDENITKVASLTKYAHLYGCTVEGELGHVGTNANPNAEQDIYTRVEDAKKYAEMTGVDALAVAIGTSHGLYREKPKLDIERLSEIEKAVNIPLVLHGGSGLSDDDFKNCIKSGICKINIFTDVNIAASTAVYKNYEDNKGMSTIIPDTVQAVKAAAMRKIQVFGSVGMA
ncbi:class II fructose-bisphosphate aldolase [Catonella morbi]|nr:class II fructose-bisphosphate aldolase [Catonella morbi]